MSGFFFALVWLPHSLSDRYAPKKNALLWFVAIFCILLGIYTLLFRETLPKMVHNGVITGTAISMNLLATLFFLIAGGRFLLDFYRSNNLEYYLFVYLALFWCLSCLLFRHSLFWGAEWWTLHMLSLGAYLLTLFIVKVHKLESIGILAGGIAHDFNNILQSLVGSLSLLRRRNPEISFMEYWKGLKKQRHGQWI